MSEASQSAMSRLACPASGVTRGDEPGVDAFHPVDVLLQRQDAVAQIVECERVRVVHRDGIGCQVEKFECLTHVNQYTKHTFVSQPTSEDSRDQPGGVRAWSRRSDFDSSKRSTRQDAGRRYVSTTKASALLDITYACRRGRAGGRGVSETRGGTRGTAAPDSKEASCDTSDPRSVETLSLLHVFRPSDRAHTSSTPAYPPLHVDRHRPRRVRCAACALEP